MIRYFLVAVAILFSVEAHGGVSYDSLTKIGTIVNFRIDSDNPGIEDSVLLAPVFKSLTGLFALQDVINLEEPILWTYQLPSKRKLKHGELDRVNANAPRTDLIVSIRMRHEYNQILGGLIPGGRHVFRIAVSVFDRQGKRVWFRKKKHSCCPTVRLSNSQDQPPDPINAKEFLDLYLLVIADLFSKR